MSKNLYFLIYKTSGKRTELILREPTLDSKDFIRIRGERANKLFRNITSVLDAYALKYGISKRGKEVLVELPADVGYAVLLYLLLAFNTRRPGKYVFFLEKLLAGKIPFVKYFTVFVDMAIDLSDLKTSKGHRGAVIKGNVARTISSIMQILVKNIEGLEK